MFIQHINGKFKIDNTINLSPNVLYNPELYPAKYFIPESYYKTFLDTLGNSIFNKKTMEFQYVFREMGQDIKPIVMDFDSKFEKLTFNTIVENKKDKRIYSDEEVYLICAELATIVKKIYGKVEFKIYVMKRPCLKYENEKIGDGLHLIIPELLAETSVLYYIRDYLINNLYVKDGAPFGNQVFVAESTIDKNVLAKTPWPIYGNSKTGKDVYLVNYIYNQDMEVSKEIPEPTELIYKFRMLHHDKATPLEDEFDRSVLNKYIVKKYETKLQLVDTKNYTEEEIQYYRSVLDNLAEFRYTDYSEWMKIGFLLAQISGKSKQMYDLWIDFSKKSNSKFDLEKCDKIWEDAKPFGWTEEILLSMLQKDNIVMYDKLLDKNINMRITAHKGEWEDADISYILYLCGKDKYKMCSLKCDDKRLFEFVQHRWRLRPNMTSLNLFLKKEIKQKFIEAKTTIDKKVNIELMSSDESTQQEDKIKTLKKKQETIGKVISKIRKDRNKKDIINSAFDEFNDYNFIDNLDKQNHKFVFQNGVFDFKSGSFADGNPTDFLTQQCPHDYFPYNENADYHQYFIAIEKFYKTLFPNENIRKYQVKLHARCLVANIKDNRTYINYGKGSNGKTKLTILLKKAFGTDYYTEINVGIFTQARKKSNEADSEKHKLKNMRIVYTSEIGKKEVLNMAIVKEVTGCGDITGARELHQSATGGTFQAKCTIFWQVNDLPKMDSDVNESSERRLRVIPYVITFKSLDSDWPKKYPDRFQYIDPELENKIEIWAKYLCSYLTHIYMTELFENDTISDPEEIIIETNKYLKTINIFEQFIDYCIEIGEENSSINASDIWLTYLSWHKTTDFIEKISKNELLDALKNKFQSYYKDNKFDGLKIKF